MAWIFLFLLLLLSRLNLPQVAVQDLCKMGTRGGVLAGRAEEVASDREAEARGGKTGDAVVVENVVGEEREGTEVVGEEEDEAAEVERIIHGEIDQHTTIRKQDILLRTSMTLGGLGRCRLLLLLLLELPGNTLMDPRSMVTLTKYHKGKRQDGDMPLSNSHSILHMDIHRDTFNHISTLGLQVNLA